VILVGFAVSGNLSTAFIRWKRYLRNRILKRAGLYRESVTNGKHRRVVNYDVSVLDARFAKKVTAHKDRFPAIRWRPRFMVQIYRKKVEKG
jgi:hypothetical protein